MIDGAVRPPIAAVELGSVVASLLQGAWRTETGSSTITEAQLGAVAPILIRSGTAALAWRRIRSTGLALTDPGREIQRARRIQAAEAAIRQAQLAQVLSLDAVREADPILLKGWANGTLYPEPAVRHYTDIDLLIRPEHQEKVAAAVAGMVLRDPERSVPVDLQTKVKDLPERTWKDLYSRSRRLPLLEGNGRTLGLEDTLRLSCVHMLRHLGFHPLWLTDISALLETLPPDFDWVYALDGDRRRSKWMVAALRLANQVLGASIDRCPPRQLPRTVPPWMVQAMLRWWGSESSFIYPWPHPKPVGHYGARGLPHAFADRWPDPLQAVGHYSWPITRLSGRTAQLFDFSSRALLWGPRQLGFFSRKRLED
jgi:Uncharacterised nucleotidyltransferase